MKSVAEAIHSTDTSWAGNSLPIPTMRAIMADDMKAFSLIK